MAAIPLGLQPDRAPEEAASDRSLAGLAGDSRTVAGWVLASRATGFLRVAIAAAILGPTYFGNLFQTLAVLPSTLFGLLIGSLVSALLVPPLVQRVDAKDWAGARALAGNFLGVALAILLLVCIAFMIGAPWVLRLITAAVDDARIREQELALGLPLLLLLIPQVALYAVISIGVAAQQARGRFALPAAAPVVENVGIIAVLGAAGLLFGTGRDVDQIVTAELLLLGIGTTTAVAAHACLQWWGAWRARIPLVPRAGWHDREVRRLLRMSIPSSGYTITYWAVFLVLLIVVGRIPGGTIAFQMGHNIFQLPIALIATPLAAAQLPRLARSFNGGRPLEFRSIYGNSIALVVFVAVPASVVLMAIPSTLASAVAFGAMAGPAGVTLIAASIGSLGLGVLGEAMMLLSTGASYARRDAIMPLRAMSIRLVIALAGIGLALATTSGTTLLWMLGITLSVANLSAGAFLLWRLLRLLPHGAGGEGRWAAADLAAAAVSMLPGLAVIHWLGHAGRGPAEHAGIALAALLPIGLCYFAIHWLRGSRELHALIPVPRCPFARKQDGRPRAPTVSLDTTPMPPGTG